MRPGGARAAALLCGLIFSPSVFAQGDTSADTDVSEAEDSPEKPEKSVEAFATPEGTFPIRRGFFVGGDFGVFFAIGGRNTNADPAIGFVPARSTSNLEPMVALTVGYDLLSTPGFNLAFGLRGALLLNGGSGRVTAEDAMGTNQEDPRTRSNDFSIYETGLAAQLDFYVTDRFSVSTKLDGGLAILNPDPSLASATTSGDPIAGAGGSGLGGMGSLAVGVNYATLLTGFQIGIDLRFTAVFFDGVIPALSATVPIKYNF